MPRRAWIDFSAVREALSFTDVLSHFEIDHPRGKKQFKISCPFHQDKTPSCSINTAGKFNCFGCDAKGNTLDFVILLQGGDPAAHEDRYAAAEVAIEIMGRDPKDFGRQSGATRSKAAKGKPAPAEPEPAAEAKEEAPAANPLFEKQLDLDYEHAFLADRGISPDQAERWELGFCSKGLMRNRIAIRLHNASGEPIGYVGRWADETVPDDEDRYKFPKGFQKSLELWNLHRALTLNKRYLVLVEGYWSTIRLHELGIPAAALMGTSISDQQAALIRASGIRYALPMLDGDEPGQAAAPVVTYTLSQHVYVRSITLPEGEKPDSVPATFLDQFL